MVDRQEMESLMSGDAPADINATMVKAIQQALSGAFPKEGIKMYELRIHYGYISPEMLGRSSGSTFCRKYLRDAQQDWRLRTKEDGGPANNIYIFIGIAGQPSEIDVIFSKDDYFYAMVRRDGFTDDQEVLWAVCDGMRGLLDLTGSIGRGDI